MLISWCLSVRHAALLATELAFNCFEILRTSAGARYELRRCPDAGKRGLPVIGGTEIGGSCSASEEFVTAPLAYRQRLLATAIVEGARGGRTTSPEGCVGSDSTGIAQPIPGDLDTEQSF